MNIACELQEGGSGETRFAVSEDVECAILGRLSTVGVSCRKQLDSDIPCVDSLPIGLESWELLYDLHDLRKARKSWRDSSGYDV